MRAAVYQRPQDIRIEELEDPRPGRGEVLLRMLACGVCGSDLMDWYTKRRAPVVLGHEPVGEVLEVGREGDGLPEVGARVFAHHHVPCMNCAMCRAGHHTLCAEFQTTGIRPGGFSELIVVSAKNARLDLLPVPDHVSTEAATLIEPLACCVRAQRRADVGPERSVVVVGAGQMGLLHVQAALAAGSPVVVAVEPIAERRELAERFGAESAEPEASAVVDALGGRADVVILCTGAEAAFALGMEVVGSGGAVQLFAPSHPSVRFSFEPNEVFFREVTIQSSYSAGPMDTREALRLLSEGAVSGEGIITHRFPLAETARALETAKSGKAIKVVVEGT